MLTYRITRAILLSTLLIGSAAASTTDQNVCSAMVGKELTGSFGVKLGNGSNSVKNATLLITSAILDSNNALPTYVLTGTVSYVNNGKTTKLRLDNSVSFCQILDQGNRVLFDFRAMNKHDGTLINWFSNVRTANHYIRGSGEIYFKASSGDIQHGLYGGRFPSPL